MDIYFRTLFFLCIFFSFHIFLCTFSLQYFSLNHYPITVYCQASQIKVQKWRLNVTCSVCRLLLFPQRTSGWDLSGFCLKYRHAHWMRAPGETGRRVFEAGQGSSATAETPGTRPCAAQWGRRDVLLGLLPSVLGLNGIKLILFIVSSIRLCFC